MDENDLEFIKINKEYIDTQLQTKNLLKYLDIVYDRIKVSPAEIDELILYYQELEYYKMCEKLTLKK